jgi:hypothetical protein
MGAGTAPIVAFAMMMMAKLAIMGAVFVVLTKSALFHGLGCRVGECVIIARRQLLINSG